MILIAKTMFVVHVQWIPMAREDHSEHNKKAKAYIENRLGIRDDLSERMCVHLPSRNSLNVKSSHLSHDLTGILSCHQHISLFIRIPSIFYSLCSGGTDIWITEGAIPISNNTVLFFELKKPDVLKATDLKCFRQTVLELVAASMQSRFRPMALLTDLVSSFRLMWMDGRKICFAKMSGASAFSILRAWIRHYNDAPLLPPMLHLFEGCRLPTVFERRGDGSDDDSDTDTLPPPNLSQRAPGASSTAANASISTSKAPLARSHSADTPGSVQDQSWELKKDGYWRSVMANRSDKRFQRFVVSQAIRNTPFLNECDEIELKFPGIYDADGVSLQT